MSQLKGTEKKVCQNCQVMEVKGGNHFRKGDMVSNVKENEDGENCWTGKGH